MRITKSPLKLAVEMSLLWEFPEDTDVYLKKLAEYLVEGLPPPKPVDEIVAEAFMMAKKVK